MFLLAAGSIPFHSLKPKTVASYMVPVTSLFAILLTAPWSLVFSHSFDTYEEAAAFRDTAWRTDITVDSTQLAQHIAQALEASEISYTSDINAVFDDEPVYIDDENTTRGYVNLENDTIVVVPMIGEKIPVVR